MLALVSFTRQGAHEDFSLLNYNAAAPGIFTAGVSALAQTPVSFSGPLAYLGNSAAIADFNADGIPNMATVDQTTSSIHIHTGVGNGTFAGDRVVDLSAVEGVGYNILLATADLNLDGLPDLIVGAGGDHQTVFALLGKPGGGFAPPSVSTAVEDLQNFYVADLNGDGKPDMVLTGQGLWFAPPNPAGIAAAFLRSQAPASGLADAMTVGGGSRRKLRGHSSQPLGSPSVSDFI